MNLRCTTQRRFYYGSRTSARKKRVLSYGTEYVDEYGKRHTPSKSTGLTVKGNKKRAEKMLSEARAAKEAELEARAIERSTGKAPAGTILFTAFLLDWLEMTKKNVEETTYGGVCNGDQKQDHSVL